MISFEENPNLGLKVVTTVTGDKEYRRNCIYIMNRQLGKGCYYKIDRDCFRVDNKWYRKDSGYIVFDYENNEWLMKHSKRLLNGIVGFNDNNQPIIGNFSPNPFNNVRSNDYGFAINADIFKGRNDYFESIYNGQYYSLANVGGRSSNSYRTLNQISTEASYRNKGYNIEDNGLEFIQKQENFAKYQFPISKEVRTFARFLGARTFGAEIETSQGFIPDHIQHRMGIVMCRDGSIEGGEAVTVPMSGAKGVQNLKNIAEEFQKRANVNTDCSYHLHLGNIPKDRVFLCALYILGYKIQDELFQMFPDYKVNWQGIKRKNYCQKLAKRAIHPLKDDSREGFDLFIEDTYNKIFEFLSDGVPASEFNNRKQLKHPIQNKWDRPSRYAFLNLQNMLFSPRGTAEFRIHHATLSPQKMTLWLFICNAIIQYAENHTAEIFKKSGKIAMADVLNIYRELNPMSSDAYALSDHLIAYMEDRKTYFDADREKGDKISAAEQEADKEFVFDRPLF